MGRKELIRKMLDGRVFKYKEYIIRYNPDESSHSPFMIEGHGTLKLWDHIEDWKEVKEWYEEIPEKGLLCKVWDCGEYEYKSVKVIRIYCKGAECFLDDNSAAWDNAKPMTLDEAKEYIL